MSTTGEPGEPFIVEPLEVPRPAQRPTPEPLAPEAPEPERVEETA